MPETAWRSIRHQFLVIPNTICLKIRLLNIAILSEWRPDHQRKKEMTYL